MPETLFSKVMQQRIDELQKENDLLRMELQERAMISEALHEGEQQFRALVACIHGAVYRFHVDPEWTLEFISDGIEGITGYPASHFMFNNVLSYRKIIHPEDTDKVKNAIFEAMDKVEPFSIEYRIIDTEGRIHWITEKGQTIYSAEGEPLWLDGAIYDDSDRKYAEEALQKANEELKRLANMDGLTQIANRRYFDECLDREWKHMRREQKNLSLIMCDIDFFKLYNDAYGHQKGDDCLRSVAQAISSEVKRPSDVAARYGGEEFILILPDTQPEGSVHIAESIRDAVQQLKISHAHSTITEHVTLSLGVSCVIPDKKILSKELVNAADVALYKAKKLGRNRVVLNNLNPH
ncbi:MAG: sensor domain-containing diguanylate cyclase [Thermodesulfobacteriota bacterium]|nr:sensor domain-containing diguanylate cyclase [Thermodesulfobacteriota bacterium]